MRKVLLIIFMVFFSCASGIDMQRIAEESQFSGEDKNVKVFIKIAPLGVLSGYFAHITVYNGGKEPIQMDANSDWFYVFNDEGRFRIVPLTETPEIQIQYPDYINAGDFSEVYCKLPENVSPESVEKFQIVVNFRTVNIEATRNTEAQ